MYTTTKGANHEADNKNNKCAALCGLLRELWPNALLIDRVSTITVAVLPGHVLDRHRRVHDHRADPPTGVPRKLYIGVVRLAQEGAAAAAYHQHSLEVEDEGHLKDFVAIFLC
jgi:hypothetical protein